MAWICELPLLVYVVAFLSFIFLVKHWMSRPGPANIPPFPCHPLPVVGHLLYLMKDTRKQMETWARSTGDMMSLYFGSHLVVFLNNYDVVRLAFVKNARHTSDRPDTIRGDLHNQENMADENGRYIGRGLGTSNGCVWKEQKKVSLNIFRQFGVGKNILAHKLQDEASIYVEALAKLAGKPSDVKTLTSTAISNVISSIVVGKRFNYDDDYIISFMDKVNEYFETLAFNSLFANFKWLRFLPGDLFLAKKRYEIYKYITEKYCKVYIDHVQKEYDESNIDNYIAAYLREMKKLNAQGQVTTLDIDNLTRVVFELFIAGTDTTSTTIRWFFLYMLHYPTKQAKMFQEICDVVGTQRHPTMEDKAKLNYTNAAIQETLRLASIIPFGVTRITTSDVKINGYTIPTGTSLFAYFDNILLSPQLWENPLVFSPERFLDEDGNFVSREELIPFSLGRRACLGESLARMNLYIFITNVVQRFEILPETPGVIPPRKPLLGLTCPPDVFQVRFVER